MLLDPPPLLKKNPKTKTKTNQPTKRQTKQKTSEQYPKKNTYVNSPRSAAIRALMSISALFLKNISSRKGNSSEPISTIFVANISIQSVIQDTKYLIKIMQQTYIKT